ncbi:hypothetical protein GCM10007916_01800 [Psychromonas marina]|uniref:Porin family protein n=1 Tax=Psychromonas marina TaxID=88364 RepID=A0ABQ6DVJ5_9GAMM|nr:hypothetical protein [Psychromonas marina]GLS89113.1 hypothetical protein GCM10007916_01800 [Psychromonas marina]
MFQTKHFLTVVTLSAITLPTFATPAPIDDFIALSAYLGGRYSEDLKDSDTGEKADIGNNFSQALALSWYYDRNKEGELLYSNSKQDLSISGKDINTDIYISYLHFGGRINFVNEGPLSTSFGLGIGATFFIPDDSQYDNDVALSGNITGGVRYALNQHWAIKADLRVYGTVLNNNSSLFCSNNTCLIELDGDIYVQTELMAGIEYKF